MSKRLIGVSIVKNEADIVEACVRHNLRYLDRMIVFDHNSTDATGDILASLVAEGLPLTLLHAAQPDVAFKQSAWTTALAHQAFEKHGADYVFPFDADEFIRAPSRDALETALASAHAEVMSMRWQTYVPNRNEQDHPLRLLRWRVETQNRPLPKIVLSRQLMNTSDWHVSRGNHMLMRQAGKDLNWNTGTDNALSSIELAHLPLRSPEQLMAKALIGGLSHSLTYGREEANTSNGWHMRELYRQVFSGKVLTNADVRKYAIAMYALNQKLIEDADAEYKLVEDPVAEPMPLLYTPDKPMNPALLVAAWSSSLVDAIARGSPPRISPGSQTLQP